MRYSLILHVFLGLMGAGCLGAGPATGPSSAQADGSATTGPDAGMLPDGATGLDDLGGAGDAVVPDSGGANGAKPDVAQGPMDTTAPAAEAAFTVGAWNLHNFSKYGFSKYGFSKYGTGEFRLDDIAAFIPTLGVDVLGVEELKVKDGTDGDSGQAFTELVARLDDYDGIHAPWDTQDTTVGLLWNTQTTTLLKSEVLFESDWSAFPRPPLVVDVSISRDGATSELSVIVVHLKAFKDSVARRRDACQKLTAWVAARSPRRYLVIGDFNDDPYDPPAKNSFVDTFLDTEPDWYFVTASLPWGSVTSIGYGTSVDGQWQDGEFLDHAMVSGPLFDAFSAITPDIVSKPPAEYATWKKKYSDHFPIRVHFQP